ncbi:MAG TPA: helix-hairpin-helix domain-containing protein [Stellaceae bacterium]|nr:helix-hairpin-helix domain-containing protein [Stellaceae bacterium]
MSENPYRLARDIPRIGFRAADQIAAKLGIEKTALVRVRAGIAHELARGHGRWPLRPSGGGAHSPHAAAPRGPDRTRRNGT